MKLIIPPPVLGLACAGTMWMASRLVHGASFVIAGQKTVAALLSIVGLAIELLSSGLFFRAKTTVNPMRPQNTTQLVMRGPYRFSRNPMYLGLAVLLSGWGVWLGNFLALTLIGFFVWYITEFQIKPEEAALREKFGEDYDAYCVRVRRWI